MSNESQPLGFPPRDARPDLWSRAEEPEPARPPARLSTHVLLFLATVVSSFAAGAHMVAPSDGVAKLLTGWTFAVPFLTILVVHEFGHYIAARIHHVDASLPYFLPLPRFSPFGTLGAVIVMRGRIRSRDALLDIGASGPLAGLVVAIPMLAYGLSLSTVGPLGNEPYMQEGQSLLYLALKRVVLGPVPAGMDVNLHPTAFAGWGGLLVTMLNLLPWGQLDGGHVAYALFGYKQHTYARWFRNSLLILVAYNLFRFVVPALHRSSMEIATAVSNSLFWLVWYVALGVIGRFFGGTEHPPTEPGVLSPKRRIVAAITLFFFVLLFMPVPLAQY
jgi:membrane-associated protease RseP (regulator of RpoE activity)